MAIKHCTTCKKPCTSMKSAIYQRKIINGCENCLDTLMQGNDFSAKFDREWQKKQYRRELTQPNQKEFARAYPDKFREIHGDDLYRKLG